jgi:hypothetical protein
VHSALFLALMLGLNEHAPAAGPKVLSPAEAACEEQVGDFRREDANVYCNIDGIIYEAREDRGPATAATIDSRRPEIASRILNHSPRARKKPPRTLKATQLRHGPNAPRGRSH